MSEIEIVGDGHVEVGREVSVGRSVQVQFARPGRLILGDYVTIGDDVRFVIDGGDVTIGDWTTLHGDCLVMSTKGVAIGAHCWFGQNCVIDGTGGLTIGNGVRVGMFSQIWTHVAAGEQIEGCTLFGTSPTLIEDDVWLVGTCTVGSGVTIGRRTVALAGSNVTKSCPAGSTLAGSPAKVKEGLSFYRDISLDEKFAMLRGWLLDAYPGYVLDAPNVTADDASISVHGGSDGRVIFIRSESDYDNAIAGDGETLCCVESKRYRKAFTPLERTVLKHLSGNKARFYA